MTRNFSAKTLLGLMAVGVALSGCDAFKDEDAPLSGDRISVLELQRALEPDDVVLEEQGLITPPEWKNEFWPQAGGYPNHSMQNLALGAGPLKLVWDADIGSGASDELPLVTQPIVIDGRIYTLDTQNELACFDTKNGKEIWRKNIRAANEDDPVIAGGIASSGGFLYVTNGYNEVLALSPTDGKIIWRKALSAASRAAPSVLDNRLFVVTMDGRLMALDATSGNILWEYTGISEAAALVGAASPAVNKDIVVPVFSSGEVTALRAANGAVAWSDNLSNVKGLGGLGEISDIKALPVMDKGLVVAISFSGRLAAIDERTGTRVWQREISGLQTPWMAGNQLFVLSSDNQVIALGRETGAIRWVTELPRFEDDEPIVLTGPVLAGGRLIVAGSGGRIFEINPETGQIARKWSAQGDISIAPVIANGTLYLLSTDGTLAAYR